MPPPKKLYPWSHPGSLTSASLACCSLLPKGSSSLLPRTPEPACPSPQLQRAPSYAAGLLLGLQRAPAFTSDLQVLAFSQNCDNKMQYKRFLALEKHLLNMCFTIPIAPAAAAADSVDNANDRVAIVETIICVSVAVLHSFNKAHRLKWTKWVWKTGVFKTSTEQSKVWAHAQCITFWCH